MSTGVGLKAVRRRVTALTRFAHYVGLVGVEGPGEVTRSVIEGYLADLAGASRSWQRRPATSGGYAASLTQSVNAAGPQLEPTAAVFNDDNPPRGPSAAHARCLSRSRARREAPEAMAA